MISKNLDFSIHNALQTSKNIPNRNFSGLFGRARYLHNRMLKF